MYDHHLYVKTLSAFARTLLAPFEVHTALTELTEVVTEVLGLTGSGVGLARGERLEFDAFFGAATAEVERTQEHVQSGPCVTAFRTQQVVAITDLTTQHDRWPDYCDVAARVGISAVASLPMRVADRCVGALNLYADAARAWPQDDLDAAVVMADMATVYLINASRDHQQSELNNQLQRALDSRVVIEQAKGVLVARHQISPDRAFERLRSHARSRNATVAAVADAVVRLGLDV
jgi:GAF domain-containing protein